MRGVVAYNGRQSAVIVGVRGAVVSPDEVLPFICWNVLEKGTHSFEMLTFIVACDIRQGQEADVAQVVHQLGDDFLLRRSHVDGLQLDHLAGVYHALLVYSVAANLLVCAAGWHFLLPNKMNCPF